MTIEQNVFNALLEMTIGQLKLKLQMNNSEVIEESDISDGINFALSMCPAPIPEEDKQELFKYVEHYFNVQHIKGCVIYDDYTESRDWYTNNKPTENYFWDRYKRYLQSSRKLDFNSINVLEQATLEDLMNSLGNPNESFEGQRTRKGLVIGDVQSGKTATYTGLICKAADAGYKVIILLAGITESLRRQTQYRVDEGVSGITIKQGVNNRETIREAVGVGIGDPSLRTSSYTTCLKDFVTDGARGIIASLGGHNSTLLFVCKKNATVLQNLFNWLNQDFNLDQSDNLIHAPLLLIDDEADNASINTNTNANSPTRINGLIRGICDKFKNATYLGFTATPFANVFIDPETSQDMKNADLFPTHFIYVLPQPSSYIGPTKIFKKDGEYYKSIKFITDIYEPTHEETREYSEEELINCSFYARHKKEWKGKLPQSLRNSIISFCIGNAIRDYRGDKKAPRTMMVNMSRFVDVQRHITEYVSRTMKDIKAVVKFDFNDDITKNYGLSLFKEFENIYTKYYSYVPVEMTKILNKDILLGAIENIDVVMVNGSKYAQPLDYAKTPRVIAVGGLALSRGLTLEGLLVSYFYRNTSTFDVLMQMGRWFGYRNGYEDIFQIWTSQTSATWYEEITNSTEELKSDLRKMFDDHMKPIDFGIKVRNESEALDITARNKMRNSHNYQLQFNFWGGYFETPYVAPNTLINRNNFDAVKHLIENLTNNGYQFEKIYSHKVGSNSDSLIVKSVSKGLVVSLLNSINVTRKNLKFDVEQIRNFVTSNNSPKLNSWDIAFRSGKSEETFQLTDSQSIFYLLRTLSNASGSIGFNAHNHLGSPADSMANLTDEQIQYVHREYKARTQRDIKTPPCDAWFNLLDDRKPLLTIYLAKPNNNPDEMELNVKRFCDNLNGDPIVGFSIGFPYNGEDDTAVMRYSVNNIYYRQLMDEYESEEDDNNDDNN